MGEQKDACGQVWSDGQITNTGYAILTLNDVVFTGESFFAAGNNGVAYRSDDGKSWGNPLNTTLKQEEHLFGIAFGGGELVAGRSWQREHYVPTT